MLVFVANMVSKQWIPSTAYSQSTSTSSFLDKESDHGSNNEIPTPRRRKSIFSTKYFWIILVMAVLLLGLIIGLSIGLTRARQSAERPHSNPATPVVQKPPPAQILGPKVDLGYTTVQGLSYPGGISQWLGVRYAQPPVGNLRFAEPQNLSADPNLQMVTQVSPLYSSSFLEMC